MNKFYILAILLLCATSLLADGPGISKDGTLVTPSHWVSILLTKKQTHSLSTTRIVSLSEKQIHKLGFNDGSINKLELVDLFDFDDCTCGIDLVGVWEFDNVFSVHQRTLKNYKDRIGKPKRFSEITTFNTIKWAKDALILGLDGEIYHDNNALSNEQIQDILSSRKDKVKIIKPSPRVLSIEKQETFLKKKGLLLFL